MTAGAYTERCSFTRAVEHLGDRWSLLLLRELALTSPQPRAIRPGSACSGALTVDASDSDPLRT
ncbi:hypothetical protein BH23CHL8_BH23CHL8_21080 [soil metagenome]